MENIAQGAGFPLMMVGMSVVFSALVILMFMMMGLKRALNYLHCRILQRRGKKLGEPAESCTNPDEVAGVLIAALALTLILEDEEAHDEESLVLTLNSIPKPYNNWWMKNVHETWHKKSSGYREIPHESNFDI